MLGIPGRTTKPSEPTRLIGSSSSDYTLNSLNSKRGLPLSFSRSSTATVTDFEGNTRVCKANELRQPGKRRVENLLTNSEDFNHASWLVGNTGAGVLPVKTPNYGVAPDGTQTACRLQCSIVSPTINTDASILSNTSNAGTNRDIFSIWVKSNTGVNQNIQIGVGSSASALSNLVVTPAWRRVSLPLMQVIRIGLRYTFSDLSCDILLWRPMQENPTSQSNQNPSEYVSTNYDFTGFELIPNRDFSQGSTGWVLPTGFTVANGGININSSTNLDSAYSSTAYTGVGLTYTVSFTISNYVSGTLQIMCGGAQVGNNVVANGTYTATVTVGAGQPAAQFRIVTSFVGSISNISVRQVWYSFGVSGVKYFDTTNGNAVVSNVVVEGLGYILGAAGTAIGPELVVNGNFSAGTTGWSVGDAGSLISSSGGVFRITNNDTTPAYAVQTAPISAVVGKTYLITGMVVTAPATGAGRVLFGGVDTGAIFGVGRFTYQIQALTTAQFVIAISTNIVSGHFIEFDNISVREVSTTSAIAGALVEPARTNLCYPSGTTGAVANTSLPTGWAVVVPTGLSYTVGALTTENGIDCVDIRIFGTATAAGTINIRTGHSTVQDAVAVSTSVTLSLFLKAIAGTQMGISISSNQYLVGVYVSSILALTGITPGASLNRYAGSFVTSASGIDSITDPILGASITLNQVVDFTIRVGGAQKELASNVSTYIPTTTAAITRAADSSYFPSSNNLTTAAGSFYIEWTPQSISDIVGHGLISCTQDINNYVQLKVNGVTSFAMAKFIAGAGYTALLSPISIVVGATYKVAGSWGPLGVLISVNGNSGTSNSNVTSAVLAANITMSNSVTQSLEKNARSWPWQLSQARLNSLTM